MNNYILFFLNRYMKSRLTYCQINDIIKEINKAVVSKYKIMHQPKASMSSVKRNLYQRFINEETKDTKGNGMGSEGGSCWGISVRNAAFWTPLPLAVGHPQLSCVSPRARQLAGPQSSLHLVSLCRLDRLLGSAKVFS
jgi:hypothetical protein